MSWTADPLQERRAEQGRRLAAARSYVDGLARRLPIDAAVVAGSVARGDFNVWSDVDVVVVSDGLPDGGRERAAVLAEGSCGGIEPHGYTSAEFCRALERGDRLACEALERGIVLAGKLPPARPG